MIETLAFGLKEIKKFWFEMHQSWCCNDEIVLERKMIEPVCNSAFLGIKIENLLFFQTRWWLTLVNQQWSFFDHSSLSEEVENSLTHHFWTITSQKMNQQVSSKIPGEHLEFIFSERSTIVDRLSIAAGRRLATVYRQQLESLAEESSGWGWLNETELNFKFLKRKFSSFASSN